MCVHFLETNFAPKMSHRDDSLASLVNQTICVIFSKKRKFTRIEAEVGEARGIYLMQLPNTMRGNVFTPAVRLAFAKYWVAFTEEFPVRRCAEMTGSLQLIADEFASTLLSDTEEC